MCYEKKHLHFHMQRFGFPEVYMIKAVHVPTVAAVCSYLYHDSYFCDIVALICCACSRWGVPAPPHRQPRWTFPPSTRCLVWNIRISPSARFAWCLHAGRGKWTCGCQKCPSATTDNYIDHSYAAGLNPFDGSAIHLGRITALFRVASCFC